MIDPLGYQDAQIYDSNHPDLGDGNANRKRRKNVKVRRTGSWYDRPPLPPPRGAPLSPIPTGLGEPDLEVTSEADIADDLLCFMPTELFGYNLAKKEWQSFELDAVKPVEFDSKAWDHLVLDDDVKVIILALPWLYGVTEISYFVSDADQRSR